MHSMYARFDVLDRTHFFPCEGMHKRRYDVSRLLGIGMRVIVDPSGVAFYPCDGVADDRLEKDAVGRPLVAVHQLSSHQTSNIHICGISLVSGIEV